MHAVQVQGFFDIPVDNLFTIPLFANYYQNKGMEGDDYVVVSPKNSGVGRSRSLAEYLNTTLAIVDQDESLEDGGYVIGDVAGKTCIMVDDILNTGHTFAEAARLLKEEGATNVYACCSHALLSPPAREVLNDAPIEDICVTDSCLTDETRHPDKLTYITCSKLMGEAVKRIHENTPMSPLFKLSEEKYL